MNIINQSYTDIDYEATFIIVKCPRRNWQNRGQKLKFQYFAFASECSKLTLFLFSVQLQRKMELITMMIRYIPTILMFLICLPVFFLFTQTTWFHLSCQFLSHKVNFFKFDKTGRVEGSLTGFFRISLRQGFHLILHNGAEIIMKSHVFIFFMRLFTIW